MTKDRNISEISRILLKSNWEKQDIVYLMSLYRLLLEDENIKEKFKFLNLYCNWTLHTEISGSPIAYKILDYIAEAMRNSADNPNTALWITHSVVVGMSFHKFQADILQVGKDYKIAGSLKLSDLKQWQIFGMLLIEILSNKPLRFPDPITNKKVQAIYDSIISKAKLTAADKMCQIIGLEFKNAEYSKTHENSPGYKGPHVEIFTIDSFKVGYHIICAFQFVTEAQVNNALKELKKK